MAKISTFVYYDSINTELTPDGPRHQLVNPLQVLSPVSLPGNFSFAISCGISGLDRSGSIRSKWSLLILIMYRYTILES